MTQHRYPPKEVGRVEERALKRVFRGGRDFNDDDATF